MPRQYTIPRSFALASLSKLARQLHDEQYLQQWHWSKAGDGIDTAFLQSFWQCHGLELAFRIGVHEYKRYTFNLRTIS